MATEKARLQFVQLTQALYATQQTVDTNTLYFCRDTNRIYLGSTLMSRPAQVVASLPETGAIQDTVYIRTSDGTIHYYDGSKFVQCYNKKVDDTAIKSVTVSGGTLTTKDFDSNSTSAYINGLVSAVAYNGGKLQITVTENGSTKTVEANVPVDNFLSTVARKEVIAGDLAGADATVYNGCAVGDVGVLFTMVNGDKTFVKLTDLVDVYEASNSTSSAITVSIDGYKVSAALKYDNNHFEQDATGALKIKASAVKAAVAVSGATENNLAGLDASGNTKDSGYAAGGVEFGNNGETTLATEAAVVAELAKKMNLTATGITEGTVMVADGSRGVKSGAVTIGTSTLGNSGTVLAVESAVKTYVDTEVGKKVAKQTSAVSGNVVKFATGGEVQDSGLTTGGATLATTPTETVLATEAAVKAYADGAASAAQTAATNVANGKVAKQTGATPGNVVLFGAGGEVADGGYSINTTADYQDSKSASDKILITEKTLAGVVSKLVAGDMGDALNGKLDNVTAGKDGEIITATATGGVEVSGKKFGGATLAATPSANTVATEAAVADAMSWTIITA
jgi:hypothetical protein